MFVGTYYVALTEILNINGTSSFSFTEAFVAIDSCD